MTSLLCIPAYSSWQFLWLSASPTLGVVCPLIFPLNSISLWFSFTSLLTSDLEFCMHYLWFLCLLVKKKSLFRIFYILKLFSLVNYALRPSALGWMLSQTVLRINGSHKTPRNFCLDFLGLKGNGKLHRNSMKNPWKVHFHFQQFC